MTAVKTLIGWLARQGFVYLALVAGMTAFAVWSSGTIKAEFLRERELHQDRAEGFDSIIAQLEVERREAEKGLKEAGEKAKKSSIPELKKELMATKRERQDLDRQKKNTQRALLNDLTLDFDAILEDRKRDLKLAYLAKKIEGLEAAIGVATSQESLSQRLIKAGEQQLFKVRDAQKRAKKECDRANAAVVRFNEQWLFVREWGTRVSGERARLERAKAEKCSPSKLRDLDSAVRKANAQLTAAGKSLTRARGWVENELPLEVDDLREQGAQELAKASDTFAAKAQRCADRVGFVSILKGALITLIGIIASPFLIRLFCYFVLAPAAMRRPAIRVRVPDGSGVAVPPADRSTISVGIRLDGREELLVRQDYLQTTSHVGAKTTQWFLDWRAPLTSWVSGLTFLTCIRGEGEVTTVSAVRDPFAELTVMTLPEGASCVLQPRALVAVVQPISRPLQVTKHWRLGSINAWLTMQLRYIVFHGPVRLVIKGGRGVRVERAEKGRVFGQDQLVGFSADLAYSVTRTETFWPYFLGREQLLKDRVDAGSGILIIEEAPLAGRHGSNVRQGIEGLLDAGMKVFGM